MAEYEDQENGHIPEDELPDINLDSTGGVGPTPSVKGLYIQPFPGGNLANPIEKFMKGSNKPEEFIPLTNVTEEEISRDERILYYQNIANFANGKMADVMLFGYNLKRAKDGRTARDVVTILSGERQRQAKEWQDRQHGAFNHARNNTALQGGTNIVGG